MLEELKAVPAWVTWRMEEREGKPTKVPCRADGAGRASASDPTTWAPFAVARESVKLNGSSGVGFVFSEADPFAGVDLDGCRDPESGAIDDWAQAIIDRLDSYAETSPSGRGVHILVKARLAPGRNRKGAVEIYERGRYFTVTGRHLDGTPTTIEDRQAKLEELRAELFASAAPTPSSSAARTSSLTDGEVLDAARSAANGAKVRQLLAGDASRYGSASEADQALVSCLSFYTQDPAQLDRLYRGSGLAREKWDREDYRRRTIAKALEGLGEVYELPSAGVIRGRRPQAPQPRTASVAPGSALGIKWTSTIKSKRVDYIWKGRIARGKLTAIGGDPGAGKGSLGIEIARHISLGQEWPDGHPCPLGRVLLLTGEDDPEDTIVPRLEVHGADRERVGVITHITTPEGGRRRVNLATDVEFLMAEAAAAGADAIIIDPLSSYLGSQANSWNDADMRQILDPLAEEATRHRIAVILVAHLTKAGGNTRALYRFQGSIATCGAARFAFLVAPHPDDRLLRVFAAMKANLGMLAPSLTFRIVSATVESIGDEVGRVQWGSTVELSADDLLSTGGGGRRPSRMPRTSSSSTSPGVANGRTRSRLQLRSRRSAAIPSGTPRQPSESGP